MADWRPWTGAPWSEPGPCGLYWVRDDEGVLLGVVEVTDRITFSGRVVTVWVENGCYPSVTKANTDDCEGWEVCEAEPPPGYEHGKRWET